MNVSNAYNQWSSTYDSMVNRTRDMEGEAIRKMLSGLSVNTVLEWGCGTGKNTGFLASLGSSMTAIDFSEEMLQQAIKRHAGTGIEFRQGNIMAEWDVQNNHFDLISSSLILEHIEDLKPVFQKAARALKPGGYCYIGELHPYKQYNGTKARFENTDGTTTIVTCFNHHVSEFINAAKLAGLSLKAMEEWFDDGSETPRIIAFLFQKTTDQS